MPIECFMSILPSLRIARSRSDYFYVVVPGLLGHSDGLVQLRFQSLVVHAGDYSTRPFAQIRC